MQSSFPCYVEIPRELEEKAYIWPDYARGDDNLAEGGEINRFVAGKMFFVKFGSNPRDPIWPVDIFLPQASDHSKIFGSLFNDAVAGFPVPFYPRSLQKGARKCCARGFRYGHSARHDFSPACARCWEPRRRRSMRFDCMTPIPRRTDISREGNRWIYSQSSRSSGSFAAFGRAAWSFMPIWRCLTATTFNAFLCTASFVLVQLETPEEAGSGPHCFLLFRRKTVLRHG